MPLNFSASKHEPIAVIGVGAMFPGSHDVKGFWQDILAGKDLISDVPPSHWLIQDYYHPDPKATDKTYCKRGGFLSYYPFDPMEYGIPPTVIPATDTSQLLGLVVAKEVLSDATAGKYADLDLSKVSVILGGSPQEALQYVAARMQQPVWQKALREAGLPESKVQKICENIANHYTPWQENTFPGLLGNVIAGRIANRFNLGGTNCITDAACAGSLAALSMAVSELQLRNTDLVITGGVDTINDIVMYMCFSKTQALSLSGDCRPFSDKADGTIIGEGLGMLALKRLSDAERDGNPIYAVIKGVGTSSDGRSKSIYAPVSQGQSKAVLRAYENAGYSPTTVELIEAHGTGTKAGDLAEFQGLTLAFAEAKAPNSQFCALGSVKSQIGHTKSSAGAAGLLKAIMSLHHKILPPTIKIDQPNPVFNIEQTPFYLNTTLRPWIGKQQHPRRAGVSSFGFGGSNFHITIEEYTGKNRAKKLRAFPSELIIFTAENPRELLKKLKETNLSENTLANLAYKSQQQINSTHLARLAIVANDLADLQQKIEEALQLIQNKPEAHLSLPKGIHYAYALASGKVAFVFPGQGSQYSNMGAELAINFDAAMAVWEKATALSIDKNVTLADVVFPKSTFKEEEKRRSLERLNETHWTQPALAAHEVALLHMLQEAGIRADCVAGHSFGELVALYAANVIDEDTLFQMAVKRGELMQQAAAIPGAMVSVQHPVQELLKLIKQWEIDVTAVNFNSPKQLVLAGTVAAITSLEKQLQQQQISYRRLAVAAAFHSSLVADCSKPFLEFLKPLAFKTTHTKIYANSSANTYPNDAKQSKQILAEQLAKPVRFQQMVEKMYEEGVRTFIEIGPQRVLSGLINQCFETQKVHTVNFDKKGEHGLNSLWNGFAQLIVLGLNPNLNTLWQEYRTPKPANKVSAHAILMNGSNYGRPYPPTSGIENLPKPNAEINENIVPSKSPNPTTTRISVMSEAVNNSSVVQMYQDLQKQLADAHSNYQKTMAESHTAFLQSMTQLAALASSPTNSMIANAAPVKVTTPAPVLAAINPAPAPISMAPVVAPIPEIKPSVVPQPIMSVPPVAPPIVTAPPIVQMSATQTAVSTTAAPTSQTNDLQKMLLDVVVEKTGYPAEMLNMDMSIEADLGIDSIKRVEILSSLADRVPKLSEISPNDLAELRTLKDILAFIKERLPQNMNLSSQYA